VLLAGVVCLAGWQVWLTVRLLQQDENLAIQRSRERLGQIADLAVAGLAISSRDWDLGLNELNALPPSPAQLARLPQGSTFVLISQDSIRIFPQRPLLFTPLPPQPVELGAAFESADELELREQQYDRAIAVLQPLTLQPATRSEALLRIARIESKANRQDASLDAYRKLASETSINPSGTPYALLAEAARVKILMALGRRKEAMAEAEQIHAGLLAGRWPLSRETFEYQWSKLSQMGIVAGEPPADAIDFANLVAALYEKWRRATVEEQGVHGQLPQANAAPVLWNATTARLCAFVAPLNWLDSTLRLPAEAGNLRWKLLFPGDAAQPGVAIIRPLGDARLEFWNVQPSLGADSGRSTLLLSGLALMLLMILGSGYVVHRAISRELRVAQLQSDFVAAVSHEFRSPLTTLRTITELLAQNRITAESQRQQSYIFLDHETMRHHRLVENLLDFGRMESGRKLYRVEAHDAFQLVRATVDDFSEQAVANGFLVEAEIGSGGQPAAAKIQVDEEAFRRALRNLLDNAMKYSPVCRTVWVNGAVEDRRVLISVRDRGMGIDANEKRAIFQKFVRGEAAKQEGIKGTGIGLAMAQQICEAMGGKIRLQSEAGVGSTFTIVLPLADD
jgi:two-component system, OmpR family, phosphate regulon sensor histidine kinase PhoR